MPVVLDSASQGGASAATSLTVSHTCAGANRTLIVATATYNTNPVETVDYGGFGASQVSTTQAFDDGGGQAQLWVLDDPPLGTNDIVITAGTPATDIAMAATSWTGVGSVGDILGTNGLGTSLSLTPTPVVAGDVIVDALLYIDTATGVVTIGADQTQRAFRNDGVGNWSIQQSSQPGSAGGVMSWSWQNSYRAALFAIVLNEAGLVAALAGRARPRDARNRGALTTIAGQPFLKVQFRGP